MGASSSIMCINLLNNDIIENNNIEDINKSKYNKEITYENGYKIIKSLNHRRGSLREYKTNKYK